MGDFSIVTDYGSSLQVTISGSRLEVLGFSHGRRVAITEEFGKITISLASDSIFIGSSAEQGTEQVSDVVQDSSSEIVLEPVTEPVTVSSSEKVPPETLFQRLIALRKKIAAEQGLPAYIIFHDKTLQEICKIIPSDLQTFGTIQGVGAAKLAKYGSRFLDAIREYMEVDHE